MKKTELPNCPQWLLDADTENEDVCYDALGRVEWLSGNFRSGDFLGNFLSGDFRGNFLGGNFRGDFLSGNFRGNFLGGAFLGDDFWSGDFLGGNFLGGNFRGNFLGGNFLAGNFLAGNFLGGNFRGGNFLGKRISRKPITIYGLAWRVYITQVGAKIGCQEHSVAAWNAFSDSEIDAMAEGALDFWKQNKGLILSVLNYEASFPVAEVTK